MDKDKAKDLEKAQKPKGAAVAEEEYLEDAAADSLYESVQIPVEMTPNFTMQIFFQVFDELCDEATVETEARNLMGTLLHLSYEAGRSSNKIFADEFQELVETDEIRDAVEEIEGGIGDVQTLADEDASYDEMSFVKDSPTKLFVRESVFDFISVMKENLEEYPELAGKDLPIPDASLMIGGFFTRGLMDSLNVLTEKSEEDEATLQKN